MADAVQAGKVRTVGVSNYSAAQLRTAHAALSGRGIALASNQVQYSAAHRPAGWRRYTSTFRGKGLATLQPVNAVVRDLAERHDKTPSQIALRWLIQQHDVLPIPGAKTARQAAENAGALSFALTESEMEALSRTTAGNV